MIPREIKVAQGQERPFAAAPLPQQTGLEMVVVTA